MFHGGTFHKQFYTCKNSCHQNTLLLDQFHIFGFFPRQLDENVQTTCWNAQIITNILRSRSTHCYFQPPSGIAQILPMISRLMKMKDPSLSVSSSLKLATIDSIQVTFGEDKESGSHSKNHWLLSVWSLTREWRLHQGQTMARAHILFLHVHSAVLVSCYLAEKMLVMASQVEQQKATTVAPYVHSNERHSTSIAVESIRILHV